MSLDHVQRVVCATDFSPTAASALAWAEAFAARESAELHVVHVWQLPEIVTPAGTAVGMADLGPQIERELDAALEKLCAGRRVTSKRTRKGLPDLEVAELAKELDADLVVVGTHGRSGLAHVLLGSIAERVIRVAPCPVVTVPAGAHLPKPGEPIVRTILAPTDLAADSEAAVAQVLALADRIGAEVALLYVLDLPGYALRHDEVLAEVERSARRDLAELAERHRVKATGLTTHVRVGLAAEVIVAVAMELDVDLVALPTHARRGMARFFLGSVAERVARTAGRAVLTLREVTA
jgi:nucleotide-binding universal stress UspA family protein